MRRNLDEGRVLYVRTSEKVEGDWKSGEKSKLKNV